MRLSLDELNLLDAYKATIAETEKVLWRGKMMLSNLKISRNLDIPFELAFYLFLFLLALCFSGSFFLVFKIILAVVTFLAVIYYSKSQKKENRRTKRAITEYIITESKVIFFQWHKNHIHIDFLLLSNIKKVLINRKIGRNKSLYLTTHHPPNFDTYNYWNDEKNPYITLLNIEGAAEVQKFLNQLIR